MLAAAHVDVVGLGLNALDTIIRLPHFPAFDSKVEILSAETLLGGQVATAVVCCQRWGLRTRYAGKVGDDFAARLHREAFASEGVEAHLIEVPHCSSQCAYILVDAYSGERTILWKRDPRLDVESHELNPEWITRAKLLHIDGHPCAPAETAARWAQHAGMIVTADLDNRYHGVEALLEHVDFLMSSREFPERLLGTSNLFESLPEIVRRFRCRVAGATLGRDGALAWDGSQFHYVPAFAVSAVDTTGAGDVFHGGFAYALLQNWPLLRALEFSCAAAALNCTAAGARGGIRPLAEIERFASEAPRRSSLFSADELRERSARALARVQISRPE
jgi:sulfofructose kinase